MLKFSYRNSKLNALARYMGLKLNQVVSLDLPAGWTCPAADICKTKTDKESGKISRFGAVLCYAAKTEAYSPNARALRWHNFESLRGLNMTDMTILIKESLPATAKIVRIHSSGDFFNDAYFTAWRSVALMCPDVTFYGYTKIPRYVQASKPSNFVLQYSHGSTQDSESGGLPTCFIEEYDNQYPNIRQVCGSHESAHEDFYAILNRENFKIGIH